MARLPGYIRAEGKPHIVNGQAQQIVRLRVWHPSLLAELWGSLDVHPEPLRPLAVLAAWLYLNWKALRGRLA
jgi:hypothetical protein